MPEGETPQAEAQATPAGAEEQVDLTALRLQVRDELLKEIRPAFEEQINTWKAKYGNESNSWGKKAKEYDDTIADLKAKVEVAKLTEEGADFVARRRGLDGRATQLDERERAIAQREAESKADLAEKALRAKWGSKLPDDWYAKARERILAGEISLFIGYEAEDLALKANGTGEPRKGPQEPRMLTNVPTGGGVTITTDNIDKLWLEGKVPIEQYRTFQRTGQL